MKKILTTLAITLLLTSCSDGIGTIMDSKKNYDTIKSKHDALLEENRRLQGEIEKQKKEVDRLNAGYKKMLN